MWAPEVINNYTMNIQALKYCFKMCQFWQKIFLFEEKAEFFVEKDIIR